MNAKPRIVKVQLSLSTTEKTRQVLVYDKRHEWFWQGTPDADLVALMGERPKAYFVATQLPDGRLSIDGEAKDQPW